MHALRRVASMAIFIARIITAGPTGIVPDLLEILDVAVSSKHMLFEFLLVCVPKLCSLGIQRTRTIIKQVNNREPLSQNRIPMGATTHLLGSPSKLCKLSNTLWTLYTALHLSFRISKQIRPEKSTLG